ncbi:DEAD-box ATP-dependent RNA helicase 31-like isoform X2 [Rhodamnia argentea]|uniref:ATP-dependent RNA helicase n=1 Tax=Rhodamnia argentea TaxID=178133 RepID=A0ABM3H7S8_9MYRT|nr:DEAD-box ATP-dependent RNA helicase 31-like isoform X2 [Rhodamnia argentea]
MSLRLKPWQSHLSQLHSLSLNPKNRHIRPPFKLPPLSSFVAICMTPARLLTHLRLLQPSLPLHSSMKLSRSLHSSRSVPVPFRAFAFRPRHAGLLAFRANSQLDVRGLSSRSSSGSRASPKSLIDDEAELSDWVSGLGKDDSVGEVSSSRVRGRSYADEVSFGVKRQRYGDSDDVVGSGRRKGRRDAEGLDSRDSRRRNVNELGDGEEFSSPRRRFDDRSNSRSARPSTWKRGGRDSDSLLVRNSRGNANSMRRNAGPLDKSEDEEDDVEERKRSMGRFDDLTSEEDSEVDDKDDDEDEFLKKSANSLFGEEKQAVVENSKRILQQSSDSYLSETRFDQCSISPLSLKAIKDAGYEKMTVVQEATLPVILKAPARDQKRPPILVLVICPTRELAVQAAAEANALLKYHPSMGVQVVIGGTRLALEQKRMQANPCQILVATPGRLKDHIENTAGFATRLMGVKVLVLDEADRLLDMGFRKDIEKIIDAIPKQRQTLLFSATVPAEVRQMCHIALKRDHEFISTVQEGSEETHSQVRQMHLVAPLDKHFSLLYALLKEHVADDVNYKVIVFCTTAMVTKLVADVLGELKLNVREIHSRKSQSYRTKVSDEFRKSKGLILVTSDVSARGVDYPDVTLVLQVGLPADRQQYIHRLGRTGRKGKEGQGILLLAPWEEFFLSTVKDLPFTKAPVPSVDPDTKKMVERALSHVEMKNKEAAYQAWLGYYNSNKKIGSDKLRLVELANEFSRSMGLDNPPAIPKLILGKMGLRNVPGLRSR